MTPRATFICGGELVPASRYRVHPVARGLDASGWNTRVLHGYGVADQKISSGVARRAYRAACRLRRAVQTASLGGRGPVVIQRLAVPWFAEPEAFLAKRGRALVFDFDDAVFLGGNGKVDSFRRRALDLVFRHAAHVVAGNQWLADGVPGNVRTSVVPTCIDTGLYVPGLPRANDKPVRLGWIGTSGNFPYLEQLVEPLAALRAAGHRFEFHACSDAEDAALFARLGAVFHAWMPEDELQFLQSLDVGLMPLEDTDWCRGKCSFKMIQYMSVGCAVVASAVGMNRDVLASGRGGHLVADGDWASPLEELITSSGERRRLGAQARQEAVRRFDIRVAVEAYRNILTGLQ